MKQMNLTKKKASTEAHQAFPPHNMLRVQHFFERPPPLGVHNVPRERLVDADECAFELTKTNRSSGHAGVGIRIRKPGFYTKDSKITVIAAIEPGDPNVPDHLDGSLARPRRWFVANDSEGTTAIQFCEFLETVLLECEGSGSFVDLHRVFLWDNLRSHLAPVVHQTVEGRPSNNVFRIVPRPACAPKYGPIEYIFCQLGDRLRERANHTWTNAILRQEIINVLGSLGTDGRFNQTFAHCGY
jgi:transposase